MHIGACNDWWMGKKQEVKRAGLLIIPSPKQIPPQPWVNWVQYPFVELQRFYWIVGFTSNIFSRNDCNLGIEHFLHRPYQYLFLEQITRAENQIAKEAPGLENIPLKICEQVSGTCFNRLILINMHMYRNTILYILYNICQFLTFASLFSEK